MVKLIKRSMLIVGLYFPREKVSGKKQMMRPLKFTKLMGSSLRIRFHILSTRLPSDKLTNQPACSHYPCCHKDRRVHTEDCLS